MIDKVSLSVLENILLSEYLRIVREVPLYPSPGQAEKQLAINVFSGRQGEQRDSPVQ
jgi:hypothetical protein